MSTLYLGHFVQFFDDDGNPLSGGKVTFYEPGTSTKKDVYTDSGLSTPAQNPVTLDSAGRATVWLNGDYKARLEKSDGTLVDETDNINPPLETETSGGNLIANGSFETQGNASTDASAWTLTAQSDGTVERVTTDNYDGEACLKFTSDGSGGGQADTDSFFVVSPGRTYEVSFALKCSVADIRNIVQVRYFDKDQSFLSSSSVYDEDTSNPTSWTVKTFTEAPPANARFAKLRILGADQSDSTAGEAKFDGVSVRLKINTASTDLSDYESAVVELGGDFDAGEEVRCERIGNRVTITGIGLLDHTATNQATSAAGAIPASFRPSTITETASHVASSAVGELRILTDGTVLIQYFDWTGSTVGASESQTRVNITYLITG